MQVTLADAVENLYHIAQDKPTSPVRLAKLAQHCIGVLGDLGLGGAEAEVTIPGGGRDKAWDVGWAWHGKYRLVLSLKSILRNLAGTMPNRIDDAMGETASVQLYSPEIVTGYVMLFDVANDSHSPKHNSTWAAYLDNCLSRVSGRRAPYWVPGTFEGYCIVRVDFSDGPKLLDDPLLVRDMLTSLADEARQRNPGIE